MYRGVFIYRIKQLWQYKISLTSSLPLYLIRGFLTISILLAFNTLSLQNNQGKELVNYIWIQTCFAPFVSAWIIDSDLNNIIKTGNIAYEYLKPIDLYWAWFIRLVSQRLLTGIISSIPLLLLINFLPVPYALKLQLSQEKLILFIVAISLALILNTVLSLLVYISVFHTFSITGSLLIFGSIMEFLGGLVIPFSLFPENMKKVLNLLPFKYGAAYPFQLLNENELSMASLIGVISQLIWIIIIIVIGKIWLESNIKHIVVQGG
ncbi:hypothetical protein ACFQAV_08395 [Companilactobacillus huachuanensis]|uniref:ABC transporter permease n=1 Tax=Companilactobacillus huachuanensis TaxID=2559914 RepID=A0ABW1RL64_9LACO|nr:hypothetical protein [Companilactobacillus huachuanensis]